MIQGPDVFDVRTQRYPVYPANDIAYIFNQCLYFSRLHTHNILTPKLRLLLCIPTAEADAILAINANDGEAGAIAEYVASSSRQAPCPPHKDMDPDRRCAIWWS